MQIDKLDPEKYAENDSMEYGRDDVQYGVTTAMVVAYLQDAHNMPRGVAVAVAHHLWDVWNDVTEDGGVKQGDMINDMVKEWTR